MSKTVWAKGVDFFDVEGIGFFIITIDLEGTSHLMMVSEARFLDLEGPHAIRFLERGYVLAAGQAIFE